jgi:diaminopimelate epimerase
MNMHFYKYQGAGNDFILIDNRNSAINYHDPQLIAHLCDRRFGIGGDGIIFLQDRDDYDFEMIYYNADGQPSSMCGNGGRCIVAFARFLGIIDSETNFLAVDGPHYAKISASGDWVSLQMIDVTEIGKDEDAYILDTGSPHYIKLVEGLKKKNVYKDGYSIRNNDTYREKGINVNFVEPMGDGYFVRTFERGVEDETYACGTGVTAVALAMAKHNHQSGSINTPIKVLGGDLNIRFNYDGQSFKDIFLEGLAVKVFEGRLRFDVYPKITFPPPPPDH